MPELIHEVVSAVTPIIAGAAIVVIKIIFDRAVEVFREFVLSKSNENDRVLLRDIVKSMVAWGEAEGLKDPAMDKFQAVKDKIISTANGMGLQFTEDQLDGLIEYYVREIWKDMIHEELAEATHMDELISIKSAK